MYSNEYSHGHCYFSLSICICEYYVQEEIMFVAKERLMNKYAKKMLFLITVE